MGMVNGMERLKVIIYLALIAICVVAIQANDTIGQDYEFEDDEIEDFDERQGGVDWFYNYYSGDYGDYWTDGRATCKDSYPKNYWKKCNTGCNKLKIRNYFNGHFNKFFKGSLRNVGSSVQWNINHQHDKYLVGGKNWRYTNPSIRRGPYGGITHTHAYYLWQLHFHWGEPGVQDKGSEHTVDGAMYPLEMHMVHVEDNFIGPKGLVNVGKAAAAKHGLAVLGIFFYIDNSKPQNQEPLSVIDDKVWEMHWPGAHSKRSLRKLAKLDSSIDLEEVEERQMEHDHALNVRSLSYGFTKL